MSLKAETRQKITFLQQEISFYKQQTDLNNKLNTKCRQVLNSLSQNTPLVTNKLSVNKSKLETQNNDLVNFISLRQHFIQHSNYWNQIWSFTHNPNYDYELLEGFDNPLYAFINNKENYSSKMTDINIYESILDYKKYKNSDLDLISSPDSQDSGIQSELLTRQNSEQSKCSSIQASQNGIDSLYSSIISSKKSSDNLFDLDDSDNDQDINHVEQHELPLGWIRCCDETGIYYWHKPSGTVTRKPPKIDLPKKNFDLNNEYDMIKEKENSNLENSQRPPFIKNSISCADFVEEKSNRVRFYVRSLGWVRINEDDLTPEKSSKAVNKCINELSRGVKDFNDVVARWGEGKDLYMDIEDNYLILIDPIDDKILNKQAIASIRVWGVGRDSGRDFAYVARDKQAKIHMCHVFRSDSGPAKEIANCLRDTCRRLIEEKKHSMPKTNSLKRPDYLPDLLSSTNKKIDMNLKLKSVSYSNDTSDNNLENVINFPQAQEEPKKSIKCKYLGFVEVNKPSGMQVLNEAIDKIYANCLNEYKKQKREKFLRVYEQKMRQNLDSDFVNLNLNDDDVDDYDYDDDEEDNSVSFYNLCDINTGRNLGSEVNVVISPSSIQVRKAYDKEPSFSSFDFSNDQDLMLECRLRYLSFMGISSDVRICGFIMHNVDNTFKCHAFLCENSSAILCKTIEAACKLRYQKCIDAHPEASQLNNANQENKNTRLASYLTSQLRSVFDNFKNKNIFTKTN